jgi:hypothetical protein
MDLQFVDYIMIAVIGGGINGIGNFGYRIVFDITV